MFVNARWAMGPRTLPLLFLSGAPKGKGLIRLCSSLCLRFLLCFFVCWFLSYGVTVGLGAFCVFFSHFIFKRINSRFLTAVLCVLSLSVSAKQNQTSFLFSLSYFFPPSSPWRA